MFNDALNLHMALYALTSDSLIAIPVATYAELNLRERQDMQRVLRDHIDAISPDLMVLAEEYGEWEDSKRRIDLLCIDRDSQLVVVELKRSDDGGHMELQALRYAAMVSTMRFEQAVTAHRQYLLSRAPPSEHAEAAIREFLAAPEGPVSLAGQVRLILVSANFSKEITSTVLWLNAQGLNVTCVKAVPYAFKESVLLDVQQVMPLPEAAEFQIAIREKTLEAAAVETNGRDFTRFRVQTKSGKVFERLPKRWLMYRAVREAIEQGVTPDEIRNAVAWRGNGMFVNAEGHLSGEELMAVFPTKSAERFFCADDEVFYVNGTTYALTNQWGNRTLEAVKNIVSRMPDGHGFIYEADE